MGENAPLRILLVNRALPCHRAGGLERHVEDLALGLAEAGHAVHMLTAPVARQDAEVYERAGIRLHAADQADPQRYTLAYLRAAGGAIERVLAREGIDVVHLQEFAGGFWRPGAGAPPVLLTVHGTITSETPLHRDVYPGLPLRARPGAWARYGRRFLFVPVWRAALRGAARICVDSQFTQRELLRDEAGLREKMRIVPLGVRAEAQVYPEHAEARRALGWDATPRLLTLGRIEWAKGHLQGLEALTRMRELAWEWIVPGSGAQLEKLRRGVQRLGLEGRVRLIGAISEAEKIQLVAAADLLLWPEQTHPAFGLVGVEAMLAGTPALGTPRGAIAEVIGDAGWVAAGADAEGLERALRPLLTRPELLAERRVVQRESALRRFGYRRMIAEYASLYRECLLG